MAAFIWAVAGTKMEDYGLVYMKTIIVFKKHNFNFHYKWQHYFHSFSTVIQKQFTCAVDISPTWTNCVTEATLVDSKLLFLVAYFTFFRTHWIWYLHKNIGCKKVRKKILHFPTIYCNGKLQGKYQSLNIFTQVFWISKIVL